ncbi:MAG: hypothetical protein FWD90_07160 [Defluviitaleaceae bacterium]|nr:hypothetical protein [Defluviitaleaceae bacterium]
MKKKLLAKTLSVVLAAVMVFAVMPGGVNPIVVPDDEPMQTTSGPKIPDQPWINGRK